MPLHLKFRSKNQQLSQPQAVRRKPRLDNPDAWAAIYGPADSSGKGAFPYCTGSLPEIPAGSQSMGNIWLISVEVKDVPDAK